METETQQNPTPAPLTFKADPVAFNAALAKLISGLKRDTDKAVTQIRQGYKGTGSKSYARQIWIRIEGHGRGGPDLWLEKGYVRIGGIIPLHKGIEKPGRVYGDDSPATVYAWIVETIKAAIPMIASDPGGVN